MPAAYSILWLFGSIATPIFQDKPAVHFSLHLEHRTVCHGRNHRREQAGTAPDVVIPARAIHLPELRRWMHRGASEEAGSWRRRASEEAGWGGLLHPSTCRTQVVTAFGAVEVVAALQHNSLEAPLFAHVATHGRALWVRRRPCTFILFRHLVALFASQLATSEKGGSWRRRTSEEAGSWRRRASEVAGWGGLLLPSTCRTQVVTAFGAVEVVAAALMEAIATAHVAIHAIVVRRRQCTFFLSRHSVALFARRLTTPSSWYREGVDNWRREKAGSWRRCASEEGGSWRRRTSDEAGSWRRRASEEASSWRRRASEEAGSWRRRASEEAGSWRRRASEEAGSWRRRASEEGGSWRRRASEEGGSCRWRASEEASSWRRRASEEAGSWRWRASEEASSWRRRASEEGGSWRRRASEEAGSCRWRASDEACSWPRCASEEAGSWRRRASEEAGSWGRCASEEVRSHECRRVGAGGLPLQSCMFCHNLL